MTDMLVRPADIIETLTVQVEPEPATNVLYPDADGPTPAEVDWAQEHLADLPVVLSQGANTVRVWQVGGEWYRDAGHIMVSPSGKARFRIWLRRGATLEDLEFLRTLIEHAREGRFARHAWRPVAGKPDVWNNNLSRGIGSGPTPPNDAPHPASDDFVIVCDDDHCTSDFHLVYDLDDPYVTHVAETFESKTDLAKYSVQVFREANEAMWKVEIYVDEFYAGDAAVSSFVNDVEWAKATCRRLNEVA